MENIHNTYPYEKLDVATREIRLLELLPGKRADPVRCKLFRHSLDEPLEYDAISYTWGDVESLSLIHVDDDDTFQTPMHTKRALRNIRLEGASRVLWIDAVCINQGDTSERSSQVRIMRDIYSRASTVRIWLDFEIDPQSPMFVRLAGLTEKSSIDELGMDSRFWSPLLGMANLPYWSRVWVQQELSCARNPVLYCRENQVSIKSLILQGKLVHRVFADGGQGREFSEWLSCQIGAVLENKGLVSSKQDSIDSPASLNRTFDNILEALVEFHHFTSTDEKDKVFATLGLLRNDDLDLMEIDYTFSLHQIYLNVILHVLDKYGSLTFLTHIRRSLGSTPCFPSWLPDWRPSSDMTNRVQSQFGRTVNPNVTRTTSTKAPVLIDKMTRLRVSGFRIDYVLKSFRNLLNSQTPDSELEEYASKTAVIWYRILEELYKVHNPQSAEGLLSKFLAFFQSQQNLSTFEGWNMADIEALFETLGISVHSSDSQLALAREFAREAKDFLDKECPNPSKGSQNAKKWKDFCNRDECSWKRGKLVFMMSTVSLRLFISRLARVGLLPPGAEPGDEIWVIFRCPTPVVLQKYGNDYIVQGPAYVSGCMRQECMRDMPDIVEPGQRFGDYLIEEITLC